MARDYTNLIIQAAERHGIDPRVALTVAKHEGGTAGWVRAKYKKGGMQEPSYGPFQMLVGGKGTGFPEGMGNQLMRERGIDPRDEKNSAEVLDFAMEQASKHGWGQWYGAAAAGIHNKQGIGGKPNGQPLPRDDENPISGYSIGPGPRGELAQSMADNPISGYSIGPGDKTLGGEFPPAPEKALTWGDRFRNAAKGFGSAVGATGSGSAPQLGTPQQIQTMMTPAQMAPPIDPQAADMQRQTLAQAMARLNSGRLY